MAASKRYFFLPPQKTVIVKQSKPSFAEREVKAVKVARLLRTNTNGQEVWKPQQINGGRLSNYEHGGHTIIAYFAERS